MKTTVPVNTTNAMGNKKRKRPKNVHKPKKDEENILSKDIEDDNIKYMMDTKKTLKPREDLKSSFTLKNLRFKPQKYKGSFLPYHLRWIFNNNVKTNEIVLLNEIEGLENEINRLKSIKIINRECRKIAGLPFGISTNFCQCCHLFEKKKHDCSHKFCNENCPRKKAEELMMNLIKNNKLKENKDINKENSANKNQNIQSEEKIKVIPNNNSNNNNIDNQNKDNIINEIKNNNSNNNEIKNGDIILNENGKNQINIANPPVTAQPKRRLIFGVVERPKEKKSIFMVKSDLVPENNKLNQNHNIDISEDDKNSYTINIDSEEDLLEAINDDKEDKKDDKKEEKKERKKRQKRKSKKDSSENESLEDDSEDSDNDNDNDNDDIIIINQTSPQSSSEYEKISDDDDD